jgi:hypothetical protein
MKLETLVGISIATMITVWTVYSWMDRWQAVSAEGFAPNVDAILAATSDKPNKQDIIIAYQTILKYIKSDFSKGIFLVNDFRSRFYPPTTPFKDGFDPARIMDDPQFRFPSESTN